MNYVLDFEVSAAILIFITIISFFSRKHFMDHQGKLYVIMLVDGFLAVAVDIVIIVLSDFMPIYLLYISNIVYFLLYHSLGPMILFYFIILAGKMGSRKDWRMILIGIPFLIDLVLIVTTPLTHLIFFMDESGVYSYGVAYYCIYALASFYLIACLIVAIAFKKELGNQRFYAALSFIIFQIIAVGIEYFCPEYIVVGFANALSLVIINYSMQSPDDYVDNLTKAYNRSALMSLLERGFAMRHHFSLVVFAMDGFKHINTIYGTDYGDDLLVCIADKLTEKYQRGHVIRLSGDIFCVMLNEKKDENKYSTYFSEFPTVWQLEHVRITITACKIALNSINFQNPSDMMTALDFSVQEIKKIGPAGSLVIGEDAIDNFKRVAKITSAISFAIKEKSIHVRYQPIISTETNKVCAAEALSRIYDAELGWISPGEFIPIAEQNGMIMEIDSIVREKVCSFLSMYNMKAAGVEYITVNLSVTECMQANLPSQIIELAKAYNVSPRELGLEITESVIALSMESLRGIMDTLKKAGFSFCLDDYGTGYSNIARLLQLPISVVKVDKLFLDLAEANIDAKKFISRLVAPFKGYGMRVIFEGVERADQLDTVKKWGADFVQGYFFSKPINEDSFVAMVNAQLK